MSRRRTVARIPWGPRWLPLIVQRLAVQAATKAADGTRRGGAFAEEADGCVWLADALPRAQLWWVTRDMTLLSVDSAEDAEGFPDDTQVDMPAPVGFIAWQDGIPVHVQQPTALAIDPVRVDAALWHWTDREFHIMLWTRDERLRKLTGSQSNIPLAPAINPTRNMPGGTMNADSLRFLNRILAATWVLSARPTVAAIREGAWDEKVDGPEPRALSKARKARSRADGPEVKLVFVRENPAPKDAPDGEPDREYSCRWIVRGHWRMQPYGPNGSLRRRQWIPPFVAGPADKPLKLKTTVHVWRQ